VLHPPFEHSQQLGNSLIFLPPLVLLDFFCIPSMSVVLMVANSITFIFFFACCLSPLVSLLSPESEGLSDVSFSASLSLFHFTFPFYKFRSCIYVGNRIKYMCLSELRLNSNVCSGFLGLQSVCDMKLVVIIGL